MAPTAVVTGASGGIGRACVEALAPDHDVLVHYHENRKAAESLADGLEGEAVVHGCDVADPDAVEGMVGRARDELGGIDVLVNNAGMILRKGIAELSAAEIQRTVAVNLLGTVYATRAALPGMVGRGEGRIVTVASTAALHGSRTDPAYGASKAGTVGFAKSIARHHTEDGVLVNAVAPTATDTAMYPEAARPATREAMPIGRLIRPEEVAEAVRFFATTTSVSGQVLEIDAGRYV